MYIVSISALQEENEHTESGSSRSAENAWLPFALREALPLRTHPQLAQFQTWSAVF